jgi:hypothetical protein
VLLNILDRTFLPAMPNRDIRQITDLDRPPVVTSTQVYIIEHSGKFH